LDNLSAALVGAWTTGTSSTDKYLADYQFAGTSVGAETATATFTPEFTTPGRYDVSIWYPQGGNRSTSVPHTIVDADGSTTTAVNQSVNGGGWRLLTSGKRFTKGTAGFVRISNATADSGKVVMADGVRFSYAANQGPVPEWWLQAYFNGPADPALDPDQDGLTTAQEYVLGTIPTEAGSAASLRVELAAADELRLVFSPYRAGRQYRLFSNSGLESSDWNVVTNAALSAVAENAGAFSVTNFSGLQRFFRVETIFPEQP
jgi:hypothetical protein